MTKYNDESRGMALVTILMVLIVLVMLTTTMLALSSNSLFYSLNYCNRLSALTAAESGVTYAIYNLQKDSSWRVDELKKTTQSGTFTIKFYRSGYTPQYFSVNHLNDPNIATGMAFDGSNVLNNSVDLIVTGNCNGTIRRIRAILTRDFINDAGRTSGLADIKANNFTISRVTTPKNPNTSGCFHSNSQGDPSDPNHTAIKTDSTTSVFAHGGIISAVGSIDMPVYDSSSGTTIISNSSPKEIPNIDIDQIISSKISSIPGSNQLNSGTYKVSYTGPDSSGNYNYTLSRNGSEIALPDGVSINNGKLIVSKDLSFNGNVKFTFKVPEEHLSNAGIQFEKSNNTTPSIYVQTGNSGDGFEVLGKIEGNGAIYNSGKTKFIMETNIVGAEDPGVALLSKGDVEMKLPASSSKSLNLNMTGLVYSNGNINASILDPLGAEQAELTGSGLEWPGNWVDKSFGAANDKSLLMKGNIDNSIPCRLIPSTADFGSYTSYGLTSTPSSPAWEFWSPDPNNATITRNSDSIYTITCKNAYSTYQVLLTYKMTYSNSYSTWSVDKRVPVYVVATDDQENVSQTINSSGLVGNNSSSTVCDVFTDPETLRFTGGKTGVLSDLRNSLNNFNFSTASDTVPNPSASVSDPNANLYGPNITITGSLIGVEPNSTGVYNPNKGNLLVNLHQVGTKFVSEKGNLTLKYSNKYEKLLGNNSSSSNLKIILWEEIKD